MSKPSGQRLRQEEHGGGGGAAHRQHSVLFPFNCPRLFPCTSTFSVFSLRSESLGELTLGSSDSAGKRQKQQHSRD